MSERPTTDPAPTGLGIVHHDVDGILVIAVTGEIDLETAPALHTAVTAGIDRSHGDPASWT